MRSSVVELGSVSASLSSQALREGKSCSQSSALGVTVRNVSEQFELPGDAGTSFAIQDIADDGSAILLTSSPVSDSKDGNAAMAVVPVTEGSIKWIGLRELLQMAGCDAVIQPEGFLEPSRILLAVAPSMAPHPRANCIDKEVFYSFELNSHRVARFNESDFTRQARVVSGPLESCKTDPDLVGACYRERARLALNDSGDGFTLWPLGGQHYLSVEEEMVPAALLAQVSPEMRVYANMLVCPMLPEPRESRMRVCIDSADTFKPDPIVPKAGRGGALQTYKH